MRLSAGVGLVSVVLTLASASAAAEESSVSAPATSSARKRPEELFEVRLRYGVAWRTGSQSDTTGPGLGYAGLTPNDPSLQAWVWPLFDLVGFTASFGREGFALFDRTTNERVTGGGLLRAQAGVTARLRLGPVRLEPVVGYAFNQVAEFGDSATPSFRAGTRHGVLLAARGLVDLGPVTVEGRFEYPLGVAASDGGGARATSTGWLAGGGVRVALLRTGLALWGLMLEGSYSSDRLSSGLQASQNLIRGSLALDLQWKEDDKTATSGALRLSVLLDEDGSPATKAALQVGDRPVVPDGNGEGRVDDLAPGTVSVRATLDGYEPAEASVGVTAGSETPVVLRLKKQLPKVGTLVVTVIDKGTRSALAGATVTVAGRALTTDAKGTVTFAELQPGAVTVDLQATGFTPKSEAATILPGLTATVSTELVSAKQRDPATVSGFVRSARGGAPVTANLSIPEAGLKAKADSKGAFLFRLNGGTYTVTISAKGYVTQTKQVTVKDGDQAIFNVDLQPK